MTEFDNLRTLLAATKVKWCAWCDEFAAGTAEASAGGRHPACREHGLPGTFEASDATAALALAAHNELPALLARLDEVTAEKDALDAVVESMREVMSPEYFKGRMMPASVSVHANARIHGMRLVVNAAPSSVLAARDAKVRAEALREAADLIENHWAPDSADGEEIVIGSVDLLRARADKEENR